jgi:ribonuclease E
MPKYEKIVKLHQEKRPIFAKYQLEEQIDLIYEKKVPLKSGGSIVIEPTEAMVSIDVNSGKTTGEKGVEDTAFKTNMEAAEEVARQLRLRDLGGLIVIDFIDMRDRKHRAEVEKTLKNALKADKARVSVDKISQFGLLEMSRQRIKQTINEASYLECPHCGGHGRVKSVEAMALSFLRKVHTAAARGTNCEVRGSLPLEVAYYLLNRKKRELAQIETDYDIEVTVKGKPSFTMNQMELEQLKREKTAGTPIEPEQPVETGTKAPAEAEPGAMTVTGEIAATAGDREETKSKRKRRRGRKKAQPPQEAASEVLAPEVEEGLPGAEPEISPLHEVETAAPEQTEETTADVSAEGAKKKRRRRRKRSTKTAAVAAPIEEAAEIPVDVVVETPYEPPPPTVESLTPEPPVIPDEKPKRKPRKPRTPKLSPEESSAAISPASPVAQSVKPARMSSDARETAPPEGAEIAQTPSTQTEEKPKRKRAPRKKKEPVTTESE